MTLSGLIKKEFWNLANANPANPANEGLGFAEIAEIAFAKSQSEKIADAIRQACKDVIDPELFCSQLTPEDCADIATERVSIAYLRCAATSMANRLHLSGHMGQPGDQVNLPQEDCSDMKISECFKGAYLRAIDLKDRAVKVTIEQVTLEAVGDDQDEKPCVSFVGKDKALVLNKTNATLLSERFGDDTDAWTGKSIELCTQRVSYQGRLVDGIRVKVPTAAPAEEFDDDIPF